MHRVVLVLAIALGGCRAASSPPPAPIAATRSPVASDAAALIARGSSATGVKRAKLARYGLAWLRLGDEPMEIASEEDEEPDQPIDWNTGERLVFAVAEARDDRARILIEGDDARLLVWVDRADLLAVVADEAGLAGEAGRDPAARGGPGVIVRPGTELARVEDAGRQRRVEIAADGLIVIGYLDATAIGDVWEGQPTTIVTSPHHLDEDVEILAAPGRGAATLAVTSDYIPVRVIGVPVNGWSQIETLGSHVTVRGFVPADVVETGDWLSPRNGVRVSDYDRSHATRVWLPGGACLYDAAGGALIGVNTVDRVRLAHEIAGGDWWAVEVDTVWRRVAVIAHDLGDEQWELCAEPDDDDE